MRKFIALSLLALLTAATALACGGWGRPHYYMFHVCPEPQEQPSSISASVNKYWIDYTGGKADSYDVGALGNVDLKKWSTSDNEIVKAIIAKNDYEAELYVKRLIGYLNISTRARRMELPHRRGEGRLLQPPRRHTSPSHGLQGRAF